MKYVIIGGVAGGATAAARIRRIDEFAEIVILERGPYISYSNCGLPYYIGNVITDRGKLLLQTPASFAKRYNIEVRVESRVTGIYPDAKIVTIQHIDGSEYSETYDKLLLSPGASPIKLSLPGTDLEGVFTLRDVVDTDRIKSHLTTRNIRKAVIVGAGLIGLEMAENLHHAGAEVSIVEMNDQVMSHLDFSMAAQVHQHLLQKGVKLYLEQTIDRFEQKGKRLEVHLKSGTKIPADIIIISVGVRPETGLALESGLQIGKAGGIWVDEYLETSKKDVYAVGDAIEFPHPITGQPWLNYLANPANRQGRIVADNMVYGNTTKYEGAIGTAIAKVFDMTVATTGLSAKRLQFLDISYQSSTTHSNSHAGYYPNAQPLSIKLMFSPADGKLYGAQSVGFDGVDKRIDQIALVIKQGGTVHDLARLEQAYAPPYSSAKDPVAIAGYVAGNIISNDMEVVTWREMQQTDKNNVTILDVRTRGEFDAGSIAGAINIPLDELRERLPEIPTDKPVYLYCAVGQRGYLAYRILKSRGYSVKNLSGGYKTYAAATAKLPGVDA